MRNVTFLNLTSNKNIAKARTFKMGAALAKLNLMLSNDVE
jgi:hypothetical protein